MTDLPAFLAEVVAERVRTPYEPGNHGIRAEVSRIAFLGHLERVHDELATLSDAVRTLPEAMAIFHLQCVVHREAVSGISLASEQFVAGMVGEMMQRVLADALHDLARARGAAYLDTFVERELARYADLFRERPDDSLGTTNMLRAWFLMEGGAALRAVVERASAEARQD